MTKSLGIGIRNEPGPKFKFMPNASEKAKPSGQVAAPVEASKRRVLKIKVKGKRTAAFVKKVAETFAGKSAVKVR